MKSFEDLAEALSLMEEYENIVSAHIGSIDGSVAKHISRLENGEFDEELKRTPGGVQVRLVRIALRYREIQAL